MNEWEDNISFCSFELWTERNLYRGRLHTDFEEERLREKKGKMYVFPITCGPLQRERRSIVWEIKMKRFLNFNYATMKFLIFHKFCSFWSFGVYGPSSSGVDDYTAERRKTEREREKRKMFFPITSPAAHHREKKFFLEK